MSGRHIDVAKAAAWFQPRLPVRPRRRTAAGDITSVLEALRAGEPVYVWSVPAGAVGDPVSVQPLLEQSDERHRRFRLLLRGNMLDDGQDRSLDQHAQYRVRIGTDRARHTDRLGED